MNFMFALLLSIAFSRKPLLDCPESQVVADCQMTGDFTDQSPLEETFKSLSLNANIQLIKCIFHNFKSDKSGVSILNVSSSENNHYSMLIHDCEFNYNTLSASLIVAENTQSDFSSSRFSHNTITGANMVEFISSPHSILGCSFNANSVTGGHNLVLDTNSAFSLISLQKSATVTIQNCCFMLSNQIDKQNSEFAFSVEDGSHVSISDNSVFNCDLKRVFEGSQNAINEHIVAFDPSTLFSQNQCSLLNDNTTAPSPSNPSEDKDKIITKYLYIAIGSVAGVIFIGIVVLIVLRMNGKCKKLEQNNSEDIDNEEKRTSYLLHEEGQEVPEVEL